MWNKSKIADHCAAFRSLFFLVAQYSQHVSLWMDFVHFCGRLTANEEAKVAGDTLSETPLWLLSQPLFFTSIKRDSFNFSSSYPAMMETVRPTQKLTFRKCDEKQHETESGFSTFHLVRPPLLPFFFLDSYSCGFLNQSASLSAFLFRKLGSNDLVWVPLFAKCDGESLEDLWADSDWRLLRGAL